MTLALAVAAVFAFGYLPVVTGPPGNLLRSGVKTASVAVLAVAAAFHALAVSGPMVLALALAFCALGDWFLSRRGDRAFMAGVGAFAAGHIAYVVLFLSHPLADPARIAQAPRLWIAAALLAMGAAMAGYLAPRAGALKWPVLAYIPIILCMGLAALALPGQGGTRIVLAAATGFIASDMVLALETFGLPSGHRALQITPYLIWPLYWCAQAGFFVAFTGAL